LSLVTWSLELSIHIGQRPPPAPSCPPLAGMPAAVDRRHGGEADSGGSGPLPSAAGAKGEGEGETAPSVSPSLGAGRSPQETDRARSQRLRMFVRRRLRGSCRCARAREGPEGRWSFPRAPFSPPCGQWASSSSDAAGAAAPVNGRASFRRRKMPRPTRLAVAVIQVSRCSHRPLESDARGERRTPSFERQAVTLNPSPCPPVASRSRLHAFVDFLRLPT